jgi:hypothetical protein
MPATKTIGQVPPWVLIKMDPPFTPIVGQFFAEDYSEDLATEWGDINIAHRSEPALQWLRGGADTATFRTTLWSEGDTSGLGIAKAVATAGLAVSGSAVTAAGGEVGRAAGTAVGGGAVAAVNAVVQQLLKARPISAQLEDLKAALRPDPKLGRPPTFMFFWGKDISFHCAVKGLGEISYDELWSDGSLKKVSLNLSLRIIRSPYSIDPTDPTAPEHLSFYKAVLPGDTYETLAGREYGVPLFGAILRQESTVAFPKAGDIVRLPSRNHFVGKTLKPQAYALGDSEDAKAARAELFNERAETGLYPRVTG